MKAIWRAILVIFMPFWASRAFSAETPQPFRIFDVIQISCESGARPDYDRVFPPGAVIKMKEDVVKAFAKAGGESSSVVLRYPIAIEGLDPSAPPLGQFSVPRADSVVRRARLAAVTDSY